MTPAFSNVVGLRPRSLAKYGVCPTCGRADGPVHHLDHQWLICERHGFKWHVGRRQIGGWQLLDPLEQLSDTASLMGLLEIEPYRPGEPGGPEAAA